MKPTDADEVVSPPVPPVPVPEPAPAPDPRRWLALSVLLVATFMDLLDVNIVTVAVPSIQSDLGASASWIQGLTAGYTLSFAVLLITGGRLGDIFGRKRMFLTGISGFVLFSALCACAVSPQMLVGCRVAQGLSAAIMVPQVLAVIHVTFPREEIGHVVSVYAGMIALAIVTGPIAGGLLIQWDPFGLGWRSIFALNVPVGLAAVVLGGRWMSESRESRSLRLDLVGVVLVSVGLLMLLLPLIAGRQLGWPPWSILLLILSVPVLVGFVVYERYKDRKDGSPLVVLDLFRIPTFRIGILVALLFNAVPAGFFLSWTLYLQGGLGWSALHTGLTTIPFALGVPIAGATAVRVLLPRFGTRCLIAGAALMVIGILSYAVLAHGLQDAITSWEVAPSMLCIGSGMGLLLAPLTGIIIGGVQPQDAGVASGLINATNQLGAAFGVAIIGGIFFSALAGTVHAQSDIALAAGSTRSAQAAAIRTCAVDTYAQNDLAKVPGSCQPLLSAADANTLQTLAVIRRRTFTASFVRALGWTSAGLVAVSMLLFFLPDDRRRTPGV